MSQKRTRRARPTAVLDTNSTQAGGTEPSAGRQPSPHQELAIRSLLAGKTVTEAAAHAGVNRETVSRWRNDDVVFIAALNRARSELREAVRTEFEGLARDAVAAIREIISSKDTPPSIRLQAAKEVLGAVQQLSFSPDECDPERLYASRIKAEYDYDRVTSYFDKALPTKVMVPYWNRLTPVDKSSAEGL